jgi:hypothetical protein
MFFGPVFLWIPEAIGRPGATARKPSVFRAHRPATQLTPRRLPSHTFCVGMLDLASVSPIVRSISNSVRRTDSPVSTNVRQKTPLIARQAVYDCAPLQLMLCSGTPALANSLSYAAVLTAKVALFAVPDCCCSFGMSVGLLFIDRFQVGKGLWGEQVEEHLLIAGM